MSNADVENCQRLSNALLYAIKSANDQSITENVNERIREALLLIGSHTEDNIAATSQIEYGPYYNSDHPEPSNVDWCGLILKESRIAVKDILYELENMDMPEELQRAFPQLSQNDWETAMRVSLLVLAMCGAIVNKEQE